MSKKVLGIGLAIVGAALMFTGVGAPLGSIALGAGLGSISVATVIGMGLMVGSNFLLGPSKPKGLTTQPTDRLAASMDLRAPRKIWFGTTAGATDVRYQAFTGTKQEYLEQIICVASHKVQAITELWLDNEKAWDSTSGVVSKFAAFLTVTARTEGTRTNGIAIDSNWTVNSTLTGCAYVHLKFLLIHEASDGGNDSPFASGVTSRMTIRGKGALVYDPRLDSTVEGGSGTQRADDQTTWAWSDSASGNPALQALWYELGWKINGKLAVGKGVPPARIDLASYAIAANACDETVTKSAANGGGTEPRYRSAGVCSEADDPGAVRDNLCASANAVLRDAGGQLSLTVIHNDLSTPVTPLGRSAFDENDVLGAMNWNQTPELSSTFNIVRGSRPDPSDTALYQMVDFPEVSLASPDGIDRIDTVTYPFVESNGQVQRLAKQRLQRNQYQGRLSFTGGPAFWGLTLGQVFAFTHAAFGWNGKLFRCAGHKMNRTGSVEIVAVEENAAIYQWDNDEAAAVTPGTPTIYDPLNDPLRRGIADASATASWPNVTSRPVELTDGRVSAGLTNTGDLNRNILTSRANLSNLLRFTGGNLFTGDLNASFGADWAASLLNRPGELVDGRVGLGLVSTGDIARDIVIGRANSSNLLRFTGGNLFTGDLNASFGAAWGSNLTGRPTELTDGRVGAGLLATGDVARDFTVTRLNSSNVLRRTGGNLFTGDLNASFGAAWDTNVTARPIHLTDTRIPTALDSSGILQTDLTVTRANSSNLLRFTGGNLFTGALNATFGADLASNVTNANLDNLADGTQFVRIPAVNIAGAGNNRRALIDFTFAGHVNKSLANVDAVQDAKLSAGLNANGDLNRDILLSRANTSNLLRFTGGNLFTGDTNATFGANLATNVVNADLDHIGDGATNRHFTDPEKTKLTGVATSATRNDDGANMYPSPVNLDRSMFTSGAFLTVRGGTPGRQIASGACARFPQNTAANPTWWPEASTSAIPCSPGETLYWSFAMVGIGNVSSDRLAVIFDAYATDGSTVSSGFGTQNFNGSDIQSAGVLDAKGSVLVPAGAAFIRPRIKRDLNSGDGYFYASEPFIGRAQKGATLGATAGVGGNLTNDVSVPGSGAFVGDSRNLKPIVAANYGFQFTGSISYATAAGSPATCTITAGAGNLVMGDTVIPYSSMGATLTGTGGSVQPITYLYVQTNAYVSGGHTLLTTTNRSDLFANSNIVPIGSIPSFTYPTSGTGGGGGGGFDGCPWIGSYVHTERGWILAVDVVKGDKVRCLTDDREGLEWATVTSNDVMLGHCFAIQGVDSGVRVTVSDSTPITLKDGSIITVREIDGHELPFETLDGGVRWEACVIHEIGEMQVCKIKCGQKTYSAGDVKGFGICTHNPKP